MSNFKKILRFALPYKKYAYLNIFFNVLYALFSTLSLLALAPVLKVIFDDKKEIYKKPVYKGILEMKSYLEDYLNYFLTQQIAEHGKFMVLMFMIGFIITVFLLKNLSNYFAMYFITFLKNGTLRDMRRTLYEKVIRLPLSYHSATTKGDTMTRVISDVNEVSSSFLSILEMLVREPLIILFTLGAMFFLSVKLSLFVLVFIPLSGFIISRIGKSLKKTSNTVMVENGKMLSTVEETLGGLRIIKSFTAESIFGSKYDETNNRLFKYTTRLNNRQNLASPLSELLGIIVIGVLLVYGGYLVFIDDTMEAGFFLTYILLAYNILTPAKDISKASYTYKRGTASAERIMEVLETENNISDTPGAVEKKEFEKSIEFTNINFKYEETNVLKDFSFTVPKGQTIALVGQSGSGKSTVANLLNRFYDVQEGSIKIDGNRYPQLYP
jgi:subfamily B ATP-binding cassette protein MsbA